MIPISAPHNVQSSLAFLKRPALRFENVTCRWLSFFIFTIGIFCRPMLSFFFDIIVLLWRVLSCFSLLEYLVERKVVYIYMLEPSVALL